MEDCMALLAKINVLEDQDLRNAIKDMLRGMIRGIVKEDLEALVKEQLSGYVKGTMQNRGEQMVKDACREFVGQQLKTGYYQKELSPVVAEALKAEILRASEEYMKGKAAAIEKAVIDKAAAALSGDKVVDRLIKKLAD
jgi:hypothetical protein